MIQSKKQQNRLQNAVQFDWRRGLPQNQRVLTQHEMFNQALWAATSNQSALQDTRSSVCLSVFAGEL